jgi:hypothetical protein
VREDERIPGGHSVGLSKTRLGQQRFREAMLGRYGEACAFTGPQPPGALEAAHLYLYSENRPFWHDSGTMRTPHDQAVETTGLVSRVEGSR